MPKTCSSTRLALRISPVATTGAKQAAVARVVYEEIRET